MNVVGLLLPDPHELLQSGLPVCAANGEDGELLLQVITVDDAELFHIFDSKIRNDIESEDVRVFGAFIADGFTFDPGEIDEIRFWNRAELENPANRENFTPNLITELELLKRSGKYYPPGN